MHARTKLICTLGPATSTPDLVHQLADAGASVFRVNLSHGTPEEQVERVHVVRKVEAERGESLAVMADLPGPKVRLGDLSAPSIRLRAGQAFELRPAGGVGDETGATVSYPELAQDIRVGDRVLLADGAVDLIVKQIDDNILTEVVRGGLIRARAGVNVPAERLSLPAITERDRDALARALDLDVDFIAQSFVRSPQDIVELRSMFGERGVPIVAKLDAAGRRSM